MVNVTYTATSTPSTENDLSLPSSPSTSSPPSSYYGALPAYTDSELDTINNHLETLEPQQILAWALENLPDLYQSTAFGLTGLAGTDMLSKLSTTPPPLIFIDTLYHFSETLDLIPQLRSRYPHTPLNVFYPELPPNTTPTAAAFEAAYGERLWEENSAYYDYLIKLEPIQRAYTQFGVHSLITGRRRSQGASRTSLPIIELDSTGRIWKLNPFARWSFKQVEVYMNENDVPRNALLAQGYRSVGDWHSTAKSGEGEAGEREGRWKGQAKTECGLHEDYFKIRVLAMKQKREAELREKDEQVPELDSTITAVA